MVFKIVQSILKLSGLISSHMAGSIAFYLFCHPTGRSRMNPEQVRFMDTANCSEMMVNSKLVKVFCWGDGARPVLMLHGWSSRAANFTKMAKALLTAGYSPVSFDAPAHGESGGKVTTILEYEEITQRLANQYGRFSALIGHSFGVLCLFKALRSAVAADKVVAISGVCEFGYLESAFSEQLKLTEKVRDNLKLRIERLFSPIEDIWQLFSVTHEAEKIVVPILLIHDESDRVVDIEQANMIADAFERNVDLHTTKNLGHRRIVADKRIIDKVVSFIGSERASVWAPTHVTEIDGASEYSVAKVIEYK
jgi:pimeloyl-ACP methyl ester carboxylesterase